MTTTYSLSEAASIIRGGSAEADVQWLRKRLCTGRFPGYKAGRHWRMTAADVEAAIASLRPVTVPIVPLASGLTPRSARRLAS